MWTLLTMNTIRILIDFGINHQQMWINLYPMYNVLLKCRIHLLDTCTVRPE